MLMAFCAVRLNLRKITPAPNCFRYGYIYYALSYFKLLFLFHLSLSLIIGHLIPVSGNSEDFPFWEWVLNLCSFRVCSWEDAVIHLLFHHSLKAFLLWCWAGYSPWSSKEEVSLHRGKLHPRTSQTSPAEMWRWEEVKWITNITYLIKHQRMTMYLTCFCLFYIFSKYL